ncbi:MAG: hypothetical protein EA409_07440 [Saprospirales bacterium]|nr:MAG: hypothetical protein EA409_07440 [Saprospirales bacterium]
MQKILLEIMNLFGVEGRSVFNPILVAALVLFSSTMFSQIHDLPCEALGDPLAGWPNEEHTEEIYGDFTNNTSFITENANGNIQNFGVAGADSSLFVKLELSDIANAIEISFLDGSVTQLAIGLIFLDNACPNPPNQDYGEEPFVNTLGQNLLIPDLVSAGAVTFSLCHLQASDFESIYLWIGGFANHSGDFELSLTQYTGPENNHCNNSIYLGELIDDREICIEGNNDGGCPAFLGDFNLCYEEFNDPFFSNTWYEFTTGDEIGSIIIDFQHFSNARVNIAIVEYSEDCVDGIREVMCESTTNGLIGNVEVQVEPNTTYFLVVGTTSGLSDDYEFCILPIAMFICQTNIYPQECLCEAPLFCELNQLDSFCFQMRDFTTLLDFFPPCGDDLLNNPHWFSFVSDWQPVELEIVPRECADGNGIQVAVFYTEFPNVPPFCQFCNPNLLRYEEVFSHCDCTEDPVEISFFPVPGRTYYVVVHGCGGDICGIDVNVISGQDAREPEPMQESYISPIQSEFFGGPDTICVNAEDIQFTVQSPYGASKLEYTFNPGSDSQILSVHGYGDWKRIPIDPSLLAQVGTFELCVRAFNDCYPDTEFICREIVVAEVEPYITVDTICRWEDYTWYGPNGDSLLYFPGEDMSGWYIFTDTFYGQFNCFRTAQLELFVLPNNFENPTQDLGIICQGDVFSYHGQDYTATGVYSIILEDQFGCDSFVDLTLLVLDADIFFDGFLCINDEIIICPAGVSFFPQPSAFGLPGELKIEFEWIQLSTQEVIHSGSGTNSCLNISVDEFTGNVDSFAVHYYLNYQDAIDEPGCHFGPFTFEIDLEELYPPTPEFIENEPACLGDTVVIVVDEPEGWNIIYLWEFGLPQDHYEILGDETESVIEVIFNQAGQFSVCARGFVICGYGEDNCTDIEILYPDSTQTAPDTIVCSGDFQLFSNGSHGFWSLVSAPEGAVVEIQNTENPVTEVSVDTEGDFLFSWTEVVPGLPHCTVDDTIRITVAEAPSLDNIGYECNNADGTFTVSFDIVGGYRPFDLSFGEGSINGDRFTSDPHPSGQQLNIVIIDSLGCQSDTLVFFRNCDCPTSIGSFNTEPISLCENDCIILSDFYDPTGQSHEEGLDTFGFMLFPQPIFDPNFDDAIAFNPQGEFCFNSDILEYDTDYFAFFVLGKKSESTLFDPEDPCLVFSAPKPLRWNSSPVLEWEGLTASCDNTFQLNVNQNIGSGSWSFVSGTGSVQISEPGNTETEVVLSECGTYIFRFVGSNDQCMDSLDIELEYHCSPQLVSGSIAYDCFPDLTYAVQFQIEGGSPPYSVASGSGEISGNEYTGEGFPSGTTAQIQITDSNGCGFTVEIFRDCDCETSAGLLPDGQVALCITDTTAELGEFLLDPNIPIGYSGSFILYSQPSDPFSSLLSVSESGVFDPGNLNIQCGNSYFVSFVVTDSIEGDFINTDDACFEITAGREVVWNCEYNLEIVAAATICGLSANIQVNGQQHSGQWELISGGPATFSPIDQPNTILSVEEFGLHCFSWIENNGPCVLSDTFCMDFQEGLQLVQGSVNVECDSAFENYTVTFQLTGGDPETYVLNGPGIIQGNVVISDPIPGGEPYSFEVTDGSDCDPVLVEGIQDCECESQAGALLEDEFVICGNEPFSFSALSYDESGEVLGPGAVRTYVLQKGAALNPDSILLQSTDPNLNFGPNGDIEPGQTYYIVVVVSTVDSEGDIDFSDPCLDYSAVVSVTWFDLPQATIPDGEYTIDCEFTELSIEVLPEDASYVFQWTTDDGSILSSTETRRIVTVLSGGLYRVEVSDADSGCSVTLEVEVGESADIPEVNISEPSTITCSDSIVVIDGSSSAHGDHLVYDWSGPGIISGLGTLEIAVDREGSYLLVIRDTLNGCTAQAAVTVTEEKELPEINLSVSGELNCGTEMVSISSEGSSTGTDFELSWTVVGTSGNIVSGENSEEVTVDESGIYSLTIVNSRTGCESTDLIEVFENTEQIRGADLNSGGNLCFGDRDGFIEVLNIEGGTPPFEYSFDGGNSFVPNSMVDGLNPGTFTVVIRDQLDCEYRESIVIEAPFELVVDLGPDHFVDPGEIVLIEADLNVDESSIISYVWDPNPDQSCSNCPYQEFNARENLNLSLTVMDSIGCTASDEVRIRVIGRNDVYIPNAFSPNGDGVNDVFGVYNEPGILKTIREFMVFDRWGEKVFMRENLEGTVEPGNDNSWDGSFNGELVAPGVYFYRLVLEFVDGTDQVIHGEVTLVR